MSAEALYPQQVCPWASVPTPPTRALDGSENVSHLAYEWITLI